MSFRSLLAFSALTLFIVLTALSFLEGCARSNSPASSPERRAARAAVETTAIATEALDHACARVVRARQDKDLAHRCRDAYVEARAAIFGVAEAVDAWERIEQGRDVVCPLVESWRHLGVIVTELRARDEPLPPVVEDARLLAAALGGCHE